MISDVFFFFKLSFAGEREALGGERIEKEKEVASGQIIQIEEDNIEGKTESVTESWQSFFYLF